MKSILLASMCLAYDPAGNCVDRRVSPEQVWEGPTSSIMCEEELAASMRRLKQHGYERQFQLECETVGGGE